MSCFTARLHRVRRVTAETTAALPASAPPAPAPPSPTPPPQRLLPSTGQDCAPHKNTLRIKTGKNRINEKDAVWLSGYTIIHPDSHTASLFIYSSLFSSNLRIRFLTSSSLLLNSVLTPVIYRKASSHSLMEYDDILYIKRTVEVRKVLTAGEILQSGQQPPLGFIWHHIKLLFFFLHVYFQFLLCNLYIAIIYDICRKIKEMQPISCIFRRKPWIKN